MEEYGGVVDVVVGECPRKDVAGVRGSVSVEVFVVSAESATVVVVVQDAGESVEKRTKLTAGRSAGEKPTKTVSTWSETDVLNVVAEGRTGMMRRRTDARPVALLLEGGNRG